MRYTFILLLLSCKLFAQNGPVKLPGLLQHDKFFLKIPTVVGDTIFGYCDTGGGYTAIYRSTIDLLQLKNAIKEVKIDDELTRFIAAEDLYKNDIIPHPTIARYFSSTISKPFLEIPEDNRESEFIRNLLPHDVFLGQFFFINHSWTFNYLNGALLVNTPVSRDLPGTNSQSLGFKKDRSGKKIFGHPRFMLEVDGKQMDFLFDTGAMLLLSDSGRIKMGVASNAMGGSFIARSVFDQWHKDHPDWKMIPKGEITGADLILVPQIKFGDLLSGPVWFAKRPDEAWSKGMIGSMDKVVKGAIGGSFLKYFKVTIDYNSEMIRFEQ